MRIAATGATGFIGRRLVESLRAAGHEVRVLSRKPGPYQWDPLGGPPSKAALEGVDAVVHLAGEPVAQRWTPPAKRLIRESRVLGTRHLVQAFSSLSKPPAVLVAASAVGYYGSRGEEVLTEDAPPGAGFLPETCVEWEQASESAAGLGVRVVRLRIGVVLGRGGGALQQMLPPFRMGVGGPLAGGRQWMSWIHLEDLVGLIRFALENPSVAGPLNATAPTPVRNAEFTRALAGVLHRPAFFPVPALALKLLFGEMSEVVLGSQRAVPQAAERAGFDFHFPEAAGALQSIIGA
jgi:uncharacterized protein